MLKKLKGKIIEALISVLPVTLIVIILNLTPLVDFSAKEIGLFCGCAVLLLLGIGLFNLGADLAMTPMGKYVGEGLTKSRKLTLLISVCFIMGVLITVAEPDLTVLAHQVSNIINPTSLIIFVGVGVGLFLVIAMLKIVYKVQLANILMLFYFLMFGLAALMLETGRGDLLALSFDSGGVTTGPITVPFIMALGVGIAITIGGRHASENSFGLIALCSVGPIIAVMIMALFSSGNITYTIPDYGIANDIVAAFGNTLLSVTKEVLKALSLVVVVFFIINIIFLKIPAKKIKQILFGILFTFVGLVVFLTAVNVGFMPVGYKMGSNMAENSTKALIIFSFVMGMVVVLAEPAVHVLNKQVEEITNGGVSKKSMMIALSVGVGLAVCLSIVRIIYGFSILYYLIPGYFISLGLSVLVPRMYTAIAFDSGGVASGPLTSTFILPFAIGACSMLGGGAQSVLTDAFGIIALVAMTPLITIQSLGFSSIVKRRAREKIAMKRILASDDRQIIEFE